MRSQLRAGMRRHAAADAHRKMIAARKRPDVALEVRKKLHGDGVSGLRNEIALGHFQFVALQCAGSGKQLVARARGHHQKIALAPLAVDAIPRLVASGVRRDHMRMMHAAACFLRAFEQHAVEHAARIDDDGMRHVQLYAVLVAADQFDRMNEFFRVRVIEQEREALDGFMGESAATGFFPRQMLVENVYLMARARQLFAAHRTGRSATDNRNLSHGLSRETCVSLRARRLLAPPGPATEPAQVMGKITKQKPARSIAPKTAAAVAEPVLIRTTSMPRLWRILSIAK